MPKQSPSVRRLRDACEISCQPIGDTAAYDALRETAFAFFLARNGELVHTFRLGQWSHYAWDMCAATLTFFDERTPRVVTTVEFVGSYADVPETWLWAWANPSIAAAVTSRVHAVREYGKQHNLVPLHADHWHAPEAHGHEMTAITAYLLDARAGFRVPASVPGTTIYMAILDATWVG
jgi:hypothetical protein